MFKIAIIVVMVAVISIHAAPHGRRNYEFGRPHIGGVAHSGDVWRLEDAINENLLDNGPRGARKASWQYEISHVQQNNRKWRAEDDGERNSEEQNNQNAAQEEEELNENNQNQETEQPENEEESLENSQEVREENRRGRARNEGRRRGNGRESAERSGRRDRIDPRSRIRQEVRQNRQQEEPQSDEQNEEINESEDQVQVEQEGREEISEENSQSESEEKTEAKGIADYEYAYGVNDPATGDHKDQWEKRVGDHVEGGYILDQPDGKRQIVKYESGKQGFETNIMQIERKKGAKKAKSKKQKSVAHSYATVKQNN